MFKNPFKRGETGFPLVIGMAAVKMGDRVVQIGCAHGGRLAAIASKVGLSGRAVAVAPDASSAARAEKGAREAGLLIEIETAPPTKLPLDAEGFDLAVVDDTGGLLAGMAGTERSATVRELVRVLRPGGRVMVIGSAPRGGLGSLVGGAPAGPRFDPVPVLAADGFKSVRTLAEREGLVFVEGIKPRAPA